MAKRTQWRVSASGIEKARGCKLFEEDERIGEEYKAAGTAGHSYMEDMSKSLVGLDDDLREKVEFCRAWSNDFEREHGPFLLKEYEMRIKGNELHPPGTIDRLYFTESLALMCYDFKLGTQPVLSPADNPQILEYLYMAKLELERRGMPAPTSFIGGIVQPHLNLIDVDSIEASAIEAAGQEMRDLNEQLKYPFNQPDPSSPERCQRCRWVTECPAITGAVVRFAECADLLPMPSQLGLDALVDDRVRVIALDLASILAAWSERVKQNCKEYALQNGGTIGGIWNVGSRGNGTEITDIPGFVDGLWRAGLLQHPMDILPYMKIKRSALAESLLENPERDKEATLATIKELETTHGTARPPVSVFRRGGAKKTKEAELALDIPMLQLPEGWK